MTEPAPCTVRAAMFLLLLPVCALFRRPYGRASPVARAVAPVLCVLP